MNTAILLLGTLVLAACQQGQANSETANQRVAPAPLVEPVDPVKDPVAAVKARKQLMVNDVNLNAMRGEIIALIGDAKADSIEQCRVVGFGSKPCGGPASYIALSVKDSNETELMARIANYNAAAKAENERLGRMSDCAVVPKPTVVLQNGVCTLQAGGGNTEF
ncbi:hypothetical protein [Rheinheimera maricola]|uniref:DUF4156 domain-containing protein n=1 Tax=Rheinheimera maricola TaxID=2793282 RepID=A0ABS7XA26_9GAMM|nr:hypothetical protein [Rheinheimera maricola]MBZ9612415.1 hypothetical protein [Rheinheimera maricola]